MRSEIIRKPSGLRANLADYAASAASFSWDVARSWLDGLPNGGINICHEAVVRHAAGQQRDREAIRWLGKTGARRTLTYGELDAATARFANALAALGVRVGDVVFALAGRIPELYIAALGTLRAGAIFCPLFSAFGPEPIAARIGLGKGTVLVTTQRLYEKKIAPIRERLTTIRHVLVVPDKDGATVPPSTLSWDDSVGPASPDHRIPPTPPQTPALLHFTSGTTGTPKGALHVHDAVVMHHMTGRYALDLGAADVFWCTADPGWVTGTSYGIIAPLTCGATLLVDEAEFDVERWYDTLEREHVTVWYTAPTAIRMLMKAGAAPAKRRDLARLRFCASVGEPLNPEAVLWSQEVLGRPFHDNWWQTETGGIMIANFAAMDVRPGSMGRPLPGVEAAIVRRKDDGHLERVEEADVEGELAFRPGWPSMFRAYVNAPERYDNCFHDGYYLSGDLAKRDADGYFWFVGRADDVIKTAGHLVGPFEVESALVEHPAVAEAAAIGRPDPLAGEVVKAFVSLRDGFQSSEMLEREILGFARTRLGPAIAPKEVVILATLPRTKSGKIMRRVLKARELGLPEGDLSTLEGSSP